MDGGVNWGVLAAVRSRERTVTRLSRYQERAEEHEIYILTDTDGFSTAGSTPATPRNNHMKHAARLSVSLLGCRMLRVVLGKSQLRLVLEQAGLKPVKRFEMPFIALGVTGAGWFGTKDGALLDMQELTESDLKSSCGLNADEIARFKVALAERVHHKNAKNETRSTSAREHRSWSPMDRLLWSARLGFQQFGGGLRHVGVESLRDMFEVSDAELYAAGLRTLQVRRLRRSFAAMASRRNLTRRVHLLQNPAAQRRMLAALDDRSSAADVLMERTGFAFGADLTRHLRIRHGVTRAGEIGELHEADLLESGYAITSQTGGLACACSVAYVSVYSLPLIRSRRGSLSRGAARAPCSSVALRRYWEHEQGAMRMRPHRGRTRATLSMRVTATHPSRACWTTGV